MMRVFCTPYAPQYNYSESELTAYTRTYQNCHLPRISLIGRVQRESTTEPTESRPGVPTRDPERPAAHEHGHHDYSERAAQTCGTALARIFNIERLRGRISIPIDLLGRTYKTTAVERRGPPLRRHAASSTKQRRRNR